MKISLYIVVWFFIMGCAIYPLPHNEMGIVKIYVKEYASSKEWSLTDFEHVSAVETTLHKIAPVRKEWIHGFVTYFPLDYYVTLEDFTGKKYFYELSSKYLRSQEATWPVTEDQYMVLKYALVIEDAL